MKDKILVIINGQPKEFEKRKYSFQEVVALAYGSYDDSQKSYTMISTRKNDDGVYSDSEIPSARSNRPSVTIELTHLNER